MNTDNELRVLAPSKASGRTSTPNQTNTHLAMMQSFEETRESTATRIQFSLPSEPLPFHNAASQMAASPPRRDAEAEDTEEDLQEQARRAEAESIALARALMAEEAMAASYAMSMDYLNHNRDQFSEEDLAALQAAMEEDEPEEVEVPLEDEDGGMSYELMLRLGDRLGDVKSERWARVAREKINVLPTFQFCPKAVCDKDEDDYEVKCLVCQFAYEKDDGLRRLPCSHCFHTECVDQWLMTKDFCPYCRTAIVEE
jgi:hypothetical protein